MSRTLIVAVLSIVTTGLAAQAPQKPAPNDYSKADSWLCRPGKDGACTSNQDATTVAADGSIAPQPFRRAADPAFDCFYVYPTASEDATAYSDMIPGREVAVTTAQFGRYGAVCRQFAPLYRSFTLAALRARDAGKPMAGYAATNYDDVVDAWNYYIKNDNRGRGFVLVGHSQGSGLITRLIQNEIEGKPIQKQMIAAYTPGTTVQVPPGKDVGGAYQSVPVCRNPEQFGCVIVYASYRSTLPPSITPPARYGVARTAEGTVAACANPAALGGGKATLDTYQTRGTAEWAKGKTIDTPYVRMPDMLTGECVTRGENTYLEITVNGPADGPRRNVANGDVGDDGTWGMHNGDMSNVIGDLVTLAKRQADAWARAR